MLFFFFFFFHYGSFFLLYMWPLIVQLNNMSTIILLLELGYMLYMLFNFLDQMGRSWEASFSVTMRWYFFSSAFVLFCFSICFVSISFLIFFHYLNCFFSMIFFINYFLLLCPFLYFCYVFCFHVYVCFFVPNFS